MNWLTESPPPIPTLAQCGIPGIWSAFPGGRAVAQAVRRMGEAAQTLGARIIPVRVPDISAINTIGRIILLSEASALMERHLAHRDNFGADVLALLDQGRLLSATDYVNAQRLRRLAQQEFQALWRHVDCLLTPTT